MSTNRNLLTSPVGQVHFMAVNNPMKETDGDAKYTIKVSYDVEKDKDFLAAVAEINDAKVVTQHTYRGKKTSACYEKNMSILKQGRAFVSANSKFKPKVYDAAGNELEEAPSFYADSVATASMIVQPYIGTKGGTINLIAVIIHTLDTPESGDRTDRESMLAQLKAAVEASTK